MTIAASQFGPGLIALGAAVAVLPWLDRQSRLARPIVIVLVELLALRYLLWRVFCTLPPFSLSLDSILSALFLVIETVALISGLLSMGFFMRTRDRRPDADARQGWHNNAEKTPLVDVLVCTYNEEANILERTLVGALSQTYPDFRVWLLDDGRRPAIALLCRELGCGYLTRPDNAHAKAGNINAALRQLDAMERRPDYVAILDADFVPFPNFVERAIALHREPDIGIVQTPQHFVNPDPIQTNLNLAADWPDEQRFFFDIVMPSKDAWNAAFCCGTSSMIKFEPLLRIGGFPTDSVTEDFLLSLRLKEAGYSTVYLNEPLSLGLAPEGLKEYLTQRGRWCLGYMQIVRGKSGPLSLSAKNLRPLDRLILIENFLAWSASYVMRLAGLIAPLLYLLLGIKLVRADISGLMLYFLPYFVWQSAAMGWISAGRLLPILSDVSQLLATPSILKALGMGLFGRRDQKFAVTAKGGDRSSRFVEWGLFRLFFGLLVLTITAIACYFRAHNASIAAYGGITLVWCWNNVVVLTLACFVCVEQPRYRASERYPTDEVVEIGAAGRVQRRRLRNISITGALVEGEAPCPPGGLIEVKINETAIPAKVVRGREGAYAIAFEHTMRTRIAMTRHFYAAGYYKTFEAANPLAIGRALAARVFG